MAENAIVLEVTGNIRKINSIIKLLTPIGIEEIGRTGMVAVKSRSRIPPIN